MVALVTDRSRNSDADDPGTLVALGVLAALVACVAHEAVGHGGACLATGAEVTRLTTLFFRCSRGSDLTDVAGPLGSLGLGLLAAALVRFAPRSARTLRLGALTTAVIALCWFFGQLARDAAFATDDWAFAVRRPALRVVLVALGVAGYVAVIRLAVEPAAEIAQGRRWRLLAPWLAALAAATVMGALWTGHAWIGARESLQTFGLAPLGYLLTIRAALRRPAPDGEPIGPAWGLIAAAGAALLAFYVTMGQGLGPLA